jgi:hypothetical protein
LLLILFAPALPLRPADNGADILKRWTEAQSANDERARQYTYTEQTDRFTYGADGQPRKDLSETFDVISLEGTPYRKLVARNGKPLDAREQARVDKEMRQAAEDRRKHPEAPEGGKIWFGSQSADLGSQADMLNKFNNRLMGEEAVDGRMSWVFESTPMDRVVATNAHERDVLTFRKRLWIDQADRVVTKAVYTVVGDDLFAKPGSTITFTYARIAPDTWHEVSALFDIYRVKDKAFKLSARQESRMSGFRKTQ